MSGHSFGDCWFCGIECDEDFYCYGCHEFICASCNTNVETPIGHHDVYDHEEEPEEWEEPDEDYHYNDLT